MFERLMIASQRHLLVAILAALPAICFGFHVGRITIDIQAFVPRALLCAAIPCMLALLSPRYWLLPSLVYGYGFYCGYAVDTILAPVANLVVFPVATLSGEALTVAQPRSNAEFLFLLALLIATLVSLARLSYSKCITTA
jgi:hypothetical protein